MSLEAWIVVDLGFGDAGKGTITDFLVRERGAEWVVRFNGGAQAGHNVVTDDGRHHTFSQLGAGSFVPGVRSYLGPDFVLHPGALLEEARALARVGIPDAFERLYDFVGEARMEHVGVFTYSRQVMGTVGSGLARVSPVPALVIVLAHSITLFVFASQGLRDFLLGSTAARIVRHAPCSVHVLR